MLRSLLFFVALLLVLTGCRREDWKSATFDLPNGRSCDVIIARIMALDPETPPRVTVEEGRLTVHYNSLHIASKNIEYVLEN